VTNNLSKNIVQPSADQNDVSNEKLVLGIMFGVIRVLAFGDTKWESVSRFLVVALHFEVEVHET
jgi:hypothetical protein